MLSAKKYQKWLTFKKRKQEWAKLAAGARPAEAERGERRSPTPPVRRRAVLREAPEVRAYLPERPVEETARPCPGQPAATFRPARQDESSGGRSTSPSRREGAAGPAAEKGPAKGAGKGKKGGGGKKGGRGGKGSKSHQG